MKKLLSILTVSTITFGAASCKKKVNTATNNVVKTTTQSVFPQGKTPYGITAITTSDNFKTFDLKLKDGSTLNVKNDGVKGMFRNEKGIPARFKYLGKFWYPGRVEYPQKRNKKATFEWYTMLGPTTSGGSTYSNNKPSTVTEIVTITPPKELEVKIEIHQDWIEGGLADAQSRDEMKATSPKLDKNKMLKSKSKTTKLKTQTPTASTVAENVDIPIVPWSQPTVEEQINELKGLDIPKESVESIAFVNAEIARLEAALEGTSTQNLEQLKAEYMELLEGPTTHSAKQVEATYRERIQSEYNERTQIDGYKAVPDFISWDLGSLENVGPTLDLPDGTTTTVTGDFEGGYNIEYKYNPQNPDFIKKIIWPTGGEDGALAIELIDLASGTSIASLGKPVITVEEIVAQQN